MSIKSTQESSNELLNLKKTLINCCEGSAFEYTKAYLKTCTTEHGNEHTDAEIYEFIDNFRKYLKAYASRNLPAVTDNIADTELYLFHSHLMDNYEFYTSKFVPYSFEKYYHQILDELWVTNYSKQYLRIREKERATKIKFGILSVLTGGSFFVMLLYIFEVRNLWLKLFLIFVTIIFVFASVEFNKIAYNNEKENYRQFH